MFQNRLCALLGIRYPIIQGGMTWMANAELAAAVSQAGGLGLISPNAGAALDSNMADHLRRQIRRARELTDKPLGVNLPLNWPGVEELIPVLLEEGVKVVVCSAGNPATYTPRLKAAGITVLHVVASVRHAQGAERRGVDAVIAEGYEAGGHNGLDEIATFPLTAQVARAVQIPVVAAGGVADARGFVAALALGAEGVQMGTAFIATQECIAHPRFKEAVLQATDTGTVITGRKIGPTRGIKNPVTAHLLEMEARGASAEELEAFLGPGRARAGALEGDVENGEFYCGSIAGLIREILPAGEVVRRIIAGVPQVLARLNTGKPVQRTRIGELFGLRYPILQGGMGWIANAELAAAVSNAGGLGLISPTAGASGRTRYSDNLRQQIRKARELTNQPFGVNVGLETEDPKSQLEAALEEGVRIIVTAAGPPNLYTKRLKEAGAKVMHTVFSVRHAQRAEQEGVDAVIACGYEAGGLLARDELTTMTLIPQVAGAVKIPVVAAGGIADARGFVAALALGAEGIQMGTAFIATQECIAHPKFKEAVLKASDTDTAVTGRKSGAARVLKYELTRKIQEMEARGASGEELQDFLGLGRLERAVLEGDLDGGSPMCGQIAGMISSVVPAGEVVRRIVAEAEAVLARLHQETGS